MISPNFHHDSRVRENSEVVMKFTKNGGFLCDFPVKLNITMEIHHF